MYADTPMPKWLRRAFINAFVYGDSGEAGSWDKVFGRLRTRAQFARMWRHMDAAENVLRLVAKAKADGVPVDDDLFAKVAALVSQTAASHNRTKQAHRGRGIPLQRAWQSVSFAE